MTIAADVQSLTPGSLVELFELDATALGGSLMRFHAGANELNGDVVWNGNAYTRFPITTSGFEWSGKGTMPRPKVSVANVTSVISALCLQFSDLVNAKLTRKRTFVKYLDAVNFAAGNAGADPTAHIPDEIWFVDRKSGENKIFVEFELSPAWDVQGIQLPRRQVIQNVCSWTYKGPECSWTPGAFFDVNDVATTNSVLDVCGKRICSCKCRFGVYAPLPYGGFPSAGLTQ
jgi:lambda family phage minor tail protein L